MAAARNVPEISEAAARRIWLQAQRLDTPAPFGDGPQATRLAVEHLGYVQIDTINVIERCHHHILWSRIPGYRRADLETAQSADKSVFEYWTHALSYVPTRDIRFFLPDMKRHRQHPDSWFRSVTKDDLLKVVTRIRSDGPLTIRHINDDVLVDKDHAWASRKPSKRALQLAFYMGVLVVSRRQGMLKTYDLVERHFGWNQRPTPASERQVIAYQLDRALRSQGVVSLDSACYLAPSRKPAMLDLIESRVRRRLLTPVRIAGAEKVAHWAEPAALEKESQAAGAEAVHILSPFDPLIIQRKRLQMLFGYDHRFEAYVPRERRVLGYFALPVLVGTRIVAAIDFKTDREKGELRIQKWTWIGEDTDATARGLIDDEIGRFEAFQLGKA